MSFNKLIIQSICMFQFELFTTKTFHTQFQSTNLEILKSFSLHTDNANISIQFSLYLKDE
nr:MAG TPA: hypothetical protein [Caudoviricetes sp.]